MSVWVVRPVSAEPLKWLEDAADVIFRDDRPAIGDRDNGVAGFGSSCDGDLAADDVVAERVVEEVDDKALGETWVADGGCRGIGGLHFESQLGDLGVRTLKHLGCDVG